MKCISVYTDNFEVFSDIFDRVVESPLEENEEQEIGALRSVIPVMCLSTIWSVCL